MLSTDVPVVWEQLRALIAAACGPTVLVGGALRDLDNGRPIKDLDFFVLVDPLSMLAWDPSFYEAQLRSTIPGLEVVQQLQTDYADFRDEVFHVTTCRVPDIPEEIQVIFAHLVAPIDAVRRVDFGLCQIGWDGTEVIKTPEYLDDQRNARFTLLTGATGYQRDRSVRRHERFRQKYVGWPMVEPLFA